MEQTFLDLPVAAVSLTFWKFTKMQISECIRPSFEQKLCIFQWNMNLLQTQIYSKLNAKDNKLIHSCINYSVADYHQL